MKLYFDFETHSLLDDILAAVSPVRPVTLDELQIFDASTQHHIRQIERLREPFVDSTCGRAIPMMAILDEPGLYIANGTEVLLPAAKPDGTLNT